MYIVGDSARYIASGKQQEQWGLTASAATGTQTLPISFSTTNYAIVVSQSDWDSNAEKYCARVKTRNKSSFSWFWGSVFQSGNGRLCFIVAGHQKQWGKSTGQTTTLPIAFPTAAFRGYAQYNETGNTTGNADMTVTITRTTIKTYRNYGYNFWAVGH